MQAELQEDEVLLAFLDDTYIVTSHERTATAFATLQGALMIETGIHLNPGKTKIWNAAGVKPAGCDVLQRIAETFDPTATVARFRFADVPAGDENLGYAIGSSRFREGEFGIQKCQPPEVFGQNPSVAGCSSVMVVVGPLCCSTGQLHDARGGTWGDTRILHEK